jgi:hypothetical protein
MIFIPLFFIPGIISIVEFTIYCFLKRKPLHPVLGIPLDIINIIGFPWLYITLVSQDLGIGEKSVLINHITIVLILCSILSYFLLTYLHGFIVKQNGVLTVGLVLIVAGIFFNIWLVLHEPLSILCFFNIPIILSYSREAYTAIRKLSLNESITD